MAEEERLPAVYNHPSMAKHILVGHATKTKYGFLANGRLIPGGVYPADVRTRPELYVCANCGNQFVVADDKVYCGSCSIGQVTALKTGRMTKSIRDIQPLPPPPDITQLKPPSVIDRILIADMDFGGSRHSHFVELLKENGIEYYDQATSVEINSMEISETDLQKLIAIKGIGEKTALSLLQGSLK